MSKKFAVVLFLAFLLTPRSVLAQEPNERPPVWLSQVHGLISQTFTDIFKRLDGFLVYEYRQEKITRFRAKREPGGNDDIRVSTSTAICGNTQIEWHREFSGIRQVSHNEAEIVAVEFFSVTSDPTKGCSR